MKKLLISLTVFSVLLVIGCQEKSITDPVSSESVKKEQVGTSDTYLHDFISLEGALDDPYPIGNSFYLIDGQIEYELRTVL